MTDEELAAFRRGEDWMFRRLVESESPRLLAYLSGFAGDRAEAEELTQAVWVRAFERRGSLRAGATVLGWLFSIARSVALDEGRKAARGARFLDAYRLDAPEAVDPAVRAERAERVRAAVLELPTRQRDTVVLRVLEGRSTKETAVAMGCAEGTVKAALHRALISLARELRTTMEPEEIDEIA